MSFLSTEWVAIVLVLCEVYKTWFRPYLLYRPFCSWMAGTLHMLHVIVEHVGTCVMFFAVSCRRDTLPTLCVRSVRRWLPSEQGRPRQPAALVREHVHQIYQTFIGLASVTIPSSLRTYWKVSAFWLVSLFYLKILFCTRKLRVYNAM